MIDTIIAFVWGVWFGACLAIIVVALLRGNDYVDSDK